MGPISYSRGRLFEQCPMRYYAQYIAGIKASATVPMMVGTFLHDVLDVYFKHIVAVKTSSDFTEGRAIYDRMWGSPARGTLPETMRSELLNLWQTTMEHVAGIDTKTIIGSELKLAFDADWVQVHYEAPEAIVRMRLDLATIQQGGGIIAWDYKTGFKIEAPDDSIQLKLYVLGLFLALKGKPRPMTGALYHVRVNRERAAAVTEADLEGAKAWVLGIRAAIARAEANEIAGLPNVWPARPGTCCSGCPILATCAEAAKGVVNIEDAEGLLDRLILLENQREPIREALKYWVAKNGPVERNGVVAQFKVKSKYEFPMPALKKILEEFSISLERVVKVDRKLLDKSVRGNDMAKAQVEAIVIDKSHSEFGLEGLGI